MGKDSVVSDFWRDERTKVSSIRCVGEECQNE